MLDILGFNESRVVLKANTLDVVNYHPYQSALLYIDNELIGIFGKVHPSLLEEFKIADTYYGELDFDLLNEIKTTKIKYKTIDKYPSVKRDIAIIIGNDVLASEIIKTAKSSSKLINNVEIFDIYQGEHVSDGYKSVAISLEYQASDHTLTDNEINDIHQSVLDNLSNKLKAELRS